MNIENPIREDLVFRCEACGYQTWSPESPPVCLACGGNEFTGLTPIEWRRRLDGGSILVPEVVMADPAV